MENAPFSSPYVGPRPFERQDSGRFFGRERETTELLSLIVAHRVTVLYAPSGAGKTSLLKAGLIPRLEEKGFEVLPPTRVLGPTASTELDVANIYAYQALAGLEGDEADPAYLANLTIARYLEEQGAFLDQYGLPSPRVLIFDQFEELFTAYPARWAERQGFFAQIQDALEAVPLLRVIFSLREDYLAQLEPYAEMMPDNLRHRLRLERMTSEAALSAVRGPLQDTERTFSEGTAEKLVEELQKIRVEQNTRTITAVGPFIEPVQLQVVCQNLWQSLPASVKTITERELEAYGDVTKALSQFYTTAVQYTIKQPDVKLGEGELRQWFEEQLITPAETRSLVFQDKETGLTGGIPNEAIRHLDRQHIIRGEVRSGSRWYELTHDRFIDPIIKANRAYRQALWARRVRIGLTVLGSLFGITLIGLVLSFILVDLGAGDITPEAEANIPLTVTFIAQQEARATEVAQTATQAFVQTLIAAQQTDTVLEQTRVVVAAATATAAATQAIAATNVAQNNEVLANSVNNEEATSNPDVYLARAATLFPTWSDSERLQGLVTLIQFNGETYSQGALNLFYTVTEAERQALLTSGAAVNPDALVILVRMILETWPELATTSDDASLESLIIALVPYRDNNRAAILLEQISQYKSVRASVAENNDRDAYTEYEVLLGFWGDNPVLYLERGQTAARVGNGKQAIQDYETVIDLLEKADQSDQNQIWINEFKEDLATAVCEDSVFDILSAEPIAYADSLLDQIPQDCIFWMSVWPTDYVTINQEFGANPDLYAQFGLPGHEGVDISAPQGSNVYAVADGIVERITLAKEGRTYGNAIYIRHLSSYRTLYAQLDEILVEAGDVVSAGDLIGFAGNTGNSFGAHLHFGLYMDGATEAGLTNFPFDIIDPTPYLLPLMENAGLDE